MICYFLEQEVGTWLVNINEEKARKFNAKLLATLQTGEEVEISFLHIRRCTDRCLKILLEGVIPYKKLLYIRDPIMGAYCWLHYFGEDWHPVAKFSDKQPGDKSSDDQPGDNGMYPLKSINKKRWKS